VTKIDTVACTLFWQLLHTMRAKGRILVFSQIERTSPLVMYCLKQKATEGQQEPIFFAEHDLALEWCETKRPPAESWWVQKLSADLTAD
jgi:hypothetical protein